MGKISTKILEDIGFLVGIAIFVFGLTTKDMSTGWYLGSIIIGAFLISMFRGGSS